MRLFLNLLLHPMTLGVLYVIALTLLGDWADKGWTITFSLLIWASYMGIELYYNDQGGLS